MWMRQQPSVYVTKRAQRSEDSILLWRGWADAFSSDNVVEQHSLTHFQSQPWELDVGEWECASGSALVPNCPRVPPSRCHRWNMQKTVEIPKLKDRCPIQTDTKLSASKANAERRAHWKPPTKSGQNSETWGRPRAMQDTSVKNKTRNRSWPQCAWHCEVGGDDQRKQTRPQDTREPTITKQQSSDVGGGQNRTTES